MRGRIPTVSERVAEYDALYTASLTRWDDIAKNLYMFRAMSRFYRITGQRPPERVLDVGCGAGLSLALLAKQWPSGEYYGIDLSPVAIEAATNRLPDGHFQVSALETAQFGTRFDLIMLLGVLEHFPKPGRGLSQVAGLLAPEGVVYLEVPNCISYPESEKLEGFRQLNTGSHQWEWHLLRSSWESLIRESGLHATVTLRGPRPWFEFIWILEEKSRQLSWSGSANVKWFEQRERMAANRTIQRGLAQIVRLLRRVFGDQRYRRMRDAFR